MQMLQVQSELRLFPGPMNHHRNLCALPVLRKKWINRLQQKRLPPRSHHLRQLRLRLYIAMEVELLPIQRIHPISRTSAPGKS